jgi:ferredoxin-NADP reductase
VPLRARCCATAPRPAAASTRGCSCRPPRRRSCSFAGELDALARDGVAAHRTYTRRPPSGWTGFARRVDAEMLRAVGPDPAQRPRTFVCGPTAFVETVAEALVGLGHEPATIRTERFGPTGG